MNGLLIEQVEPGSPADRAGLLPGQRLLAISDAKINDLIDYSWHQPYEPAELKVAGLDGNSFTTLLEPDPGESTGLTFAPPKPAQCGNNCIFCFVHQLPKGLRRPLYVKDEDYRLSFLYGTYVTLSNLTPAELSRIKKLRLSPLYISVHAVDPKTRQQLLGRQNIPPVLDQLQELTAANIELHTQVVLCPGINDGPVLEQTVAELARLHPEIVSLAVVPVGLTEHRQHLPQLKAVDSGYAAAFLDHWLPRMQAINRQLGEPFLQLADEFFIKAGYKFPPLKSYGDLPQWENGVGMTPWFLRESANVIRRARQLKPVHTAVITGKSATPFVKGFLDQLAFKTGCTIEIFTIPNQLFGESVTVTGLISGKDILAQLAGQTMPETVLLPDVMLKEGEGYLLDDMTVAELSNRLGSCIIPFDSTPTGLYKQLQQLSSSKYKTVVHNK